MIRSIRTILPFLLAACGLWLTSGLDCAGTLGRPPEMTPFTRAVLLVYKDDAKASARKNVAESLLYLDLEPNVPQTITVRAFDERDRPLSINPKLLAWSASANVRVQPDTGNVTTRVTLTAGSSGTLTVTAAEHKGELKIRRKQ